MSKLDWRRARVLPVASYGPVVPELLVRALVSWHANGNYLLPLAFSEARELARDLLVATIRQGAAGEDIWVAAARSRWRQLPGRQLKRRFSASGDVTGAHLHILPIPRGEMPW